MSGIPVNFEIYLIRCDVSRTQKQFN